MHSNFRHGNTVRSLNIKVIYSSKGVQSENNNEH